MFHPLTIPSLLTAAMLASCPLLRAQDMVDLHSVTIDTNSNVTVVYSKNFATCAHLRFSNTTCTQYGALTHVANIFCTQGNMISVTMPSTAFVAGFGPGIPVFMVHGNNSGVRSACVTVGCDGAYGTGCAGAAGTPVLGSTNACPPAGSSLDLALTNGPPSSLAVLGFGLTQSTFPLFGCNLLIGAVQVTTVVPFDGTGAGSLSLPLPAGSGGATLALQAYVLDLGGPQGFSATNGLLVHVL
ncbi:MAG TPA: hypothetical protein VFZ65_03235 [Planctomycetota bacterium]|nr:hypothetical protein [Planctomycetota bacterium]